MTTKASNLLIKAVETCFAASESEVDPKTKFCELFIKEVNKLHQQDLISDIERQDTINNSEQIYNSIIEQLKDPSPPSVLKGTKTSAQMFGPQFLITPTLRDKIITELGSLPIWAVISTFAADTMYAGLTLPEAINRAQIEALEPGREANIVLRLERIQGPPLCGFIKERDLNK